MSRSTTLRVVVHGAAAAAWNMAVDEMLLDGCCGAPFFTLRLYGWCSPTISVGYLQPWRDGFDASVAGRLGVGLVRRPSGGRAVLHADELTYCLVGPAGQGPLAGGVSASYRRLAAGLCSSLRRMGAEVNMARARPLQCRHPPTGACFSTRSRYELLCAGRKLVGSAQRRRDGRLLQHGSLPLGRPDSWLWRALGEDGGVAVASTIGLAEALGGRPSGRRLVWSLAGEIADALGLTARRGVLNRRELRAAARLERRYRDPEWTKRR
ncbi:MAG: biotin/lipoate A/B protein ligase family protein [Acidobacteriota bacterium]